MGTDKRPLYERDPEAWNASLAEGNARQPRKRIATDVIIRDDDDRLLLVNPTYKPDWDLPGGMAEANEAPLDAARRELWEELGLRVDITALLCVDWIPPHGPWDDTVVFVFDGGILLPDAIAALRLSDDELSGFRFCELPDAFCAPTSGSAPTRRSPPSEPAGGRPGTSIAARRSSDGDHASVSVRQVSWQSDA